MPRAAAGRFVLLHGRPRHDHRRRACGFPGQLAGAAQNQPGPDLPADERKLQRPGLLLMNGVVYAGVRLRLRRPPPGRDGSSVSSQRRPDEGALGSGSQWRRRRHLAVGRGFHPPPTGPGTLLVSTGNTGSALDAGRRATTPPSSLGESIARLTVQADGSLRGDRLLRSVRCPATRYLRATLLRLPAVSPASTHSISARQPVPHLAVAVGKDGYVYFLNRDEPRRLQAGQSRFPDKVVQRIGPYGGVWSRPGVWPGNGGWVYNPDRLRRQLGRGLPPDTCGLPVRFSLRPPVSPTLSLQASSFLTPSASARERLSSTSKAPHSVAPRSARRQVDALMAPACRPRAVPAHGRRCPSVANLCLRYSAPNRDRPPSSRPRASAPDACTWVRATARCSRSARP